MRILAVAFVAFVSLASAAHAQTLRDLLDKLKVAWNEPTEPFRVVGNVYYVGTAGLASFLITSPQGHVLIDTGLPEANPQIKANIEKLGFKVADIKQLLNTHAHLDHTGGLAGLKQETGARLAASAADKPLLEGGYYPGQESDTALNFVLFIGATTAFFTGLIGIVQNDIKRVVAYSTLSQLGYMTVALGVSAYSAAVFHLMTHAFFKALLFLGAGS